MEPDDEPDIAPRYLSMMREVLDGDPSDLESAVLEDSVITDGELQAAIDEYKSCMESHGLDAVVRSDPFGVGATEESQDRFLVDYEVRDVGLEMVAQVTTDCAIGNLASIGMIYYSMRNNPEGTSFASALRDCLASRSVDADELSDEDIERLINGERIPGLDSPEVQACVEDPFAG